MRNIRFNNDALKKSAPISYALCRSYQIAEKECSVSGSIGISIYPNDGKSYNKLLETADIALYRIKKRGKNNFAMASAPERYAL